MSGPLHGKLAVVTGGAGTIGTAVCRLLSSRGAKIVAVDRRGADFDGLAGSIPTGSFLAVEADVTDERDVTRFVEQSLSFGGRIDIFFNNAGLVGPISPLVNCTLADFRTVMAVNVEGMFLGLKYVLPGMISKRRGSVINTASIAGVGAMPGVAAYTTSKHAVIGLTKSAAVEVGEHGVRVNCICPGPISGPLINSTDGARSADHAQRERIIPARRYGQPTEVAGLVGFLASDESSYINGSVHFVDGGLHALRAT